MSSRTMVIITYCLANLLWENAVSLQTKANTHTCTSFFQNEYCFFFPWNAAYSLLIPWFIFLSMLLPHTPPQTRTHVHTLYLHIIGINAASLSSTVITIKVLKQQYRYKSIKKICNLKPSILSTTWELLSWDRWKGCHDGVKTKNSPIRHRPRYVTTNNMAAIESSVLRLIKMLPATKPKTKLDFSKTAILVKQFPEKLQSENTQ